MTLLWNAVQRPLRAFCVFHHLGANQEYDNGHIMYYNENAACAHTWGNVHAQGASVFFDQQSEEVFKNAGLRMKTTTTSHCRVL